MFEQPTRSISRRPAKPRSQATRRSGVRLEALEARAMLSASTSLVGGTLTLNVNAADHVNIAANSAGNFTVTDATHATVGGSGGGPFLNVKNITVNVTATGAIVSAKDNLEGGAPKPLFTALPGNFTLTDTQSNNAIGVELSRGFSVGGIVSISNTGAGSTFQQHTATFGGADQTVTGVFLDTNNRADYGSVSINGTGGTVGFDGITVLGNATVKLASAPGNTFFSDHESLFNEDPGRKLTLPHQNPTTIKGTLTVTGVANAEVYNTTIGGSVAISEIVNPKGEDHVLLGNDTIGKDLFVATYGGVNDVFLDFSTVAGKTTINQDSGKNVIGLQSNLLYGPTTLGQLKGSVLDGIFIDSVTAFQKAVATFPGGLPSDAAYLGALQAAALLPVDAGSTFLGPVTSTQGTGVHQLEIGQDPSAVTLFTAASTFTLGSGTTLDESSTTFGLRPIIKISH